MGLCERCNRRGGSASETFVREGANACTPVAAMAPARTKGGPADTQGAPAGGRDGVVGLGQAAAMVP